MSEISGQEAQGTGFIADCLKYMIFCGGFSVIAIAYHVFAGDESYGFWATLTMLILYSTLPAIGAAVGNLLRKIAMPMFIMSDGMMSILKAKAFWAFGPQAIGGFVGLMFSVALLEKWFDIR